MYEEDSGSGLKRVISYARVSTGAQAASGLGIEAQHRAVRAAAAGRGWQLIGCCTDDAVSAMIEPNRRPQLSEALARLDAGEADMIAAVRLDRFARSSRDLQALVDRAADGGWELVGLDMPADGDQPVGAFLRTILGAANQLDRALVSDRTKAALAVARSQGQRLGRPSRQPQAAKELALSLHADGMSLRKIAGVLEQAGLLTATGKTEWPHSSVKGLLRTAELDREAETNAAHHAAEQSQH
jgi:DNA invertase Pin-like site-specific DNA recombinase